MRWTGKRLFLCGCALIALTHGVTLAGVAWNRGGTPVATLKLGERELRQWRPAHDENSQLTFHLNWRVEGVSDSDVYYDVWTRKPAWLDRAALERLGFDLSLPYENGKTLFLVLEMDGPTYQRALRRAREQVGNAERQLAAAPQTGTKARTDAEQDLARTRVRLREEENDNSRLFVVAAGLDAETLRAAHPGSEYAVVRGEITVRQDDRDTSPTLKAFVSALSVENINVPYALRTAVESWLEAWKKRRKNEDAHRPDSTPVFTFAWGPRLEPWLAAVDAPGQNQ